MNKIEKLGSQGERVLAFAYKVADEIKSKESMNSEKINSTECEMGNFIFVGLVSFHDFPRPSYRRSIERFYKSGIQIIMVTGDHPLVAEIISKQLGIISSELASHQKNQVLEKFKTGYRLINNPSFSNFTSNDWDLIFQYSELIFARILPEQKSELIEQLKMRNRVVAFVGDNVNDISAIKSAHISLATDCGDFLAKEASQIYFHLFGLENLSDCFIEGRLLFENLRKCISQVFIYNILKLVFVLLSFYFKVPLAMETSVIILVYFGTELVQAISYVEELKENEILSLSPASEKSPFDFKFSDFNLVFRGLMQIIFSYWAFYSVFSDYGFTFSDTIGAGMQFRVNWNDMTSDRQIFFKNMCMNNDRYQRDNFIPNGKNCQQDFKNYLNHILSLSQSVYLLTVLWSHIAGYIVRIAAASSTSFLKVISNNFNLFLYIFTEMISIICFVYLPGLNYLLLLCHVPAKYVFLTLWMIPILVAFEKLFKICLKKFQKQNNKKLD
jgi:magnesium-transporting ATPase (P-type)